MGGEQEQKHGVCRMCRKTRSVETSTAIVCTAVLNRTWLPPSILTSRLASVALASVRGGGGGGGGEAIPMISHRVDVVGWSRNVPTDKVVLSQGRIRPERATAVLSNAYCRQKPTPHHCALLPSYQSMAMT